jgi:hypothetical protein
MKKKVCIREFFIVNIGVFWNDRYGDRRKPVEN